MGVGGSWRELEEVRDYIPVFVLFCSVGLGIGLNVNTSIIANTITKDVCKRIDVSLPNVSSIKSL